MLNFNSILIGSSDLGKLREFYEKIFDAKPTMAEGDYCGWLVGKGLFGISKHSEITGKTKEPQRILINIETREVKEEFERMKKAGATVVKEPYDMGGAWIATLADPDGNYFQLITPWEDMQK